MSTESSSSSNNGKLVAILSYPFWLIALIIHFVVGGAKTKLGAYHLRQMLGWAIVFIIAAIVFTVIGIILGLTGIAIIIKLWGIVALIVYIGFLVLWVLGLVAAIQGQEKPMPVIGAKIQSVLGGLFN